MRISGHADKRLKERCGLNKKSKDRMAEKALKEGIPHKMTKGNLKRWIDGLYLKGCHASNIRLYGNHAYIFAGETLVTVISIPPDLRKKMNKMIKKAEDEKEEAETVVE